MEVAAILWDERVLMEDYTGSLCIVNGIVQPVSLLDTIGACTENAVYDVIRVIQGVPLFFEDHVLRLKGSLYRAGMELAVTDIALLNLVRHTAESNGLEDCNVKIVIYRSPEGVNLVLYISRSYYPPEEEYKNGVKTSLMRLVRPDPNVKLVSRNYRESVSGKLKETGAFEVLLVDRDGFITEGSRSNVFFIKSGRIFTAPGEYVLKGITRRYAMKACRMVGAEVTESLTHMDLLDEIDGIFLSGTSIKVMPVSWVDERRYNSPENRIILSVRDCFDRLMEEYIEKRK